MTTIPSPTTLGSNPRTGHLQFAKCLGLLLSVVALMLSNGPARAQSSFSAPGAGTSSAMEGPGPSAAVSGRPSTLVLTPPLVAKLGTLADGLHKEIVLCLVGIITGEVGRATDFVMPTPHESAPRAGSFDACPGESLAVWHNHPLPELVEGLGDSARPQVRARPRAPSEARELCRLSGSDIGTLAAQGRPFAVVSVDRNTWCWWSLAQVRQLARLKRSLGYPVAGQHSWSLMDRSGPPGP